MELLLLNGLTPDQNLPLSREVNTSPHLEPKHARSGETRIRTGDTTIFSRVLYQLSYLARRAIDALREG